MGRRSSDSIRARGQHEPRAEAGWITANPPRRRSEIPWQAGGVQRCQCHAFHV